MKKENYNLTQRIEELENEIEHLTDYQIITNSDIISKKIDELDYLYRVQHLRNNLKK